MTKYDSFDFTPFAETVVEYIDEGIMVADHLGKVLYYNPAVKKILDIEQNMDLLKLNDIGKFNLQKSLLRAAIDSGEVDAAGKPSGNFISFEERFKFGDSYRVVEITSGLLSDNRAKDRKRLLLFNDKTDAYQIKSVLDLTGSNLSCKDPRMLEIISRIHQIAPTNAFTLLQGESGTEKNSTCTFDTS
jgi:transcriptional regulator with PAS, ATPase and Fis domain